ncbi:hypothetical protein K1719_023874 [Acacia pycnantha]|nr:hypothetical protein K1719_023874 [Acacia pycnantha]
MDKSWIKFSCNSPIDLAGLNAFLDFALAHISYNRVSLLSQVGDKVDQEDPVNDVVRDVFGFQDNNFTKEFQGVDPVFFRNDGVREFFSLMDEANRPLYQGYRKYSKLSFLIKLYNIKYLCGITNKAMSMLLELLQDAFTDVDIPITFYRAKKIINRLGLNYEKIDACPKDYMLYWGDDARRET